MNRTQKPPLVAWLLIGALPMIALLATVSAFASQDDEEIVNDAAQVGSPMRVQLRLPPEQFEIWLFQSAGGAKKGRERIERQLNLELDEFVRLFHLTDAQKDKLMLAAAVDTHRFFAAAEVAREHYLAINNDMNAYRAVLQEISPLQQKVASGLHGEKSFFVKSLHRMLSAEREASPPEVATDLMRQHYRISVEVNLVKLGNELGLTDEQQASLVKLVLAETKPPKFTGAYEPENVFTQLAMIPPDKVEPLLDRRQHRQLDRRLQGYRVEIDETQEEINRVIIKIRREVRGSRGFSGPNKP